MEDALRSRRALDASRTPVSATARAGGEKARLLVGFEAASNSVQVVRFRDRQHCRAPGQHSVAVWRPGELREVFDQLAVSVKMWARTCDSDAASLF